MVELRYRYQMCVVHFLLCWLGWLEEGDLAEGCPRRYQRYCWIEMAPVMTTDLVRLEAVKIGLESSVKTISACAMMMLTSAHAARLHLTGVKELTRHPD